MAHTEGAGGPDTSDVQPDGKDLGPSTLVTVLDLLENFLGQAPNEAAVKTLSRGQIEELGDHVRSYSAVTAGAPAPEETTYPGGWLAGNWHQQLLRGDLNLALLYYPRLLVHDPLAEFFFRDWDAVPDGRPLTGRNGMQISGGPSMWARSNSYIDLRDDLDAVRGQLAAIVGYITDLRPLLQAEAVIMRAQWPTILHRAQALQTSLRKDVRSPEMHEAVLSAAAEGDPLPRWDTLRGMGVVPEGGFTPQDEPWQPQHEFFHLAKTLAIADAASATYAPATEGELTLLRAKARQLRSLTSGALQPVELLSEVARVLVPDLQLTAQTAVAIRQSEDSFEDWRAGLRRLARESRDDSPAELRERVQDQLQPVVRRVEKAISRSSIASTALKEQSASTMITTAVGAASAAATTGKPVVAAVSGVASGVLAWIWKAYRPPSLGGSDKIVASLIRARSAP